MATLKPHWSDVILNDARKAGRLPPRGTYGKTKEGKETNR